MSHRLYALSAWLVAAPLIAQLHLHTAHALETDRVWVVQTADDVTLLSKIKMAILNASDIRSRQIEVEVFQGQVQLLGFVETAQEKSAAERIAGGIAGVRNVRNSLEVHPPGRSAGQALDDSAITARIKAALVADTRTKAHRIEVSTHQGVVQLGGFVDSPAAKTAAANLAQSVEGVKAVENRLAVKN